MKMVDNSCLGSSDEVRIAYMDVSLGIIILNAREMLIT